jgi:two-component system, OmpR family, sensor histidine kinase KdpD
MQAAQQQERRIGQLYRMTRQLSELSGTEFLVRTAGRLLREIFSAEVVFYLREAEASLTLRYSQRSSSTCLRRWRGTREKS